MTPRFLAEHGAARGPSRRFLSGRSNGGENEAHTKLLVSLSKMMGVDIETFGYNGTGPGGLDGL